MDWNFADFAVFGALLAGVGILCTLAIRKSANAAYRAAACVALAATFLLVWINGAVGIIGNADNDANMMYFGVIIIGLIGAGIARFQAYGMSRALYATALAQVLVAVIALLADWGAAGPIWPRDILVLTTFFAALWLVSAWLFRKAAVVRAAD